MMFAKMVLLSIKRRKKEIGFVSIVTFIAVLFLAGVSLFQNVMNRYVIENNYKNYGEWIFASLDKELSHPYFASTGSCKTGAVILDDNGERTAESIGCIDEGFLGFANLTFYEGRLPEKDDEIVMNLTTLAKLGYSLDLGQTIHLQVMVEREVLQGDEVSYESETYEKDFTLVGTIRDFSMTWRYVNGYPLASCIVTEEAMEQIGGSLYTTHFYQLDRVYEGIDTEEMKNIFLGTGVIFNEYAYDKVVWGAPEMFEDVQDLIQLIAVLMLSYLMMSYVSKRRNWYYKLRCTGAGRYQIWAMIFIEGLYGTVPWAVFGFCVPYAVGAVACSIVSQKLALPNIFVVDVAEICTQMVTVAGIILLVLLFACLGTSDRRLSNNTAEVTSEQLWRLKRVAHGGRNKAKQFIKRQNVRNPWQKAAMTVCTFVVSTILVCCVCMIMEEYEYYDLVTGNHHDFSASKLEWVEGNSYTVVETDWSGKEVEKEVVFTLEEFLYRYDCGINEKLEKELDAIEGIAYREEELYDGSSKLVWDDQRESATYQFQYEHNNANARFISDEERWRYVEDEMSYPIRIDTYEDLKRNYPMIFVHAQIDETAFRNGEQIVVVCPEMEYGYMTDDGRFVDGIMVKDTMLKDGMQVIFQNSYLGVELPVEICLPEITNEQLTEGNKFLISDYMVFASSGFAERVAAEAGTQMEYNGLKIDFEPNTAFGSTTKRLAAALAAHGFEYDLGWETKAMAREEFYKDLCVYGTLFCMIAITYLVLQMNVQQMKHYNRGAQYQQMKRLGMSNAFFLWLHVKEGIKDGLWLLSGLVTGYAIAVSIKEPLIFQPEEHNCLMVVSSITGEETSEPFLVLYECMIEQFQVEQFMVLMGILLFLMVMMIVIAIGTANKALHKEGETV